MAGRVKGMKLYIINDNGVKGQEGMSEEDIASADDVKDIINLYESKGIVVYRYFIG